MSDRARGASGASVRGTSDTARRCDDDDDDDEGESESGGRVVGWVTGSTRHTSKPNE